MPAKPQIQVITANALETGDVVYLTGHDEWSPRLSEAELIGDPERASLCLAVAERQTCRVVDAHLAAVEITDAGPVPVTRREALRARGPSSGSSLSSSPAIAAE